MLRAAAFASLVLATSGPAAAQDRPDRYDEAREQGSVETEAAGLAQAGYAAFLGGRFESALAHFRRAFELHDDPYYLLDIARTSDALRRDAEARVAYRGYLQRVPQSRRRPEIEARLRAIEGALRVRPPPTDEDEPGQVSGTIVEPGLSRWSDDSIAWVDPEGDAEDETTLLPPPPPARDQPATSAEGYPTWMWVLAGVSVGAAVLSVIALLAISNDAPSSGTVTSVTAPSAGAGAPLLTF